jgi:hypothetical protein
MKLPALFYHFFEHKQSNNNLSFSEYINIHYSTSNDHDDDFETDMNLPFKSPVNSSAAALSLCIPFTSGKHVFQSIDTIAVTDMFFYTCSYSNAYLDSIWQPPKYC